MRDQQSTGTPPVERLEEPSADGVRHPLGRLLTMFGPTAFGPSLVWGAVPSVLLALQVEHAYGQHRKVAVLAVITACGALTSMVMQPIAGVISDRTRTRFGRRAPWMLVGTAATGLALVGLAGANTELTFVIAWMAAQVGLNLAWSPMTAILPDRVPRTLRGTFASVWGAGAMLGALGGLIYGAAFEKNIPTGYLVLAVIVPVIAAAFVIICPDTSSRDLPTERFSLRAFLGAFWVNPVKHPDFAWAFTSRMFAYAGYHLVFGYQLYILQDYIGLGGRAVHAVTLAGLIAMAGLCVSTLTAGRISDRIGRRKVFVLVSSALVAGAMMIPLVTPTLTGYLVMSGISGIGFGCFQAVDTALISEVLPSQNHHAKDLGIVNIAATLPATIAPGLAGAIVVTTGSYGALFPVGAILGILAAVCVLPVKRVR
jgi:MFS family permease